jgi:hypothetical protein
MPMAELGEGPGLRGGVEVSNVSGQPVLLFYNTPRQRPVGFGELSNGVARCLPSCVAPSTSG